MGTPSPHAGHSTGQARYEDCDHRAAAASMEFMTWVQMLELALDAGEVGEAKEYVRRLRLLAAILDTEFPLGDPA